jgi:hypothetical protein
VRSHQASNPGVGSPRAPSVDPRRFEVSNAASIPEAHEVHANDRHFRILIFSIKSFGAAQPRDGSLQGAYLIVAERIVG